jgi:hypothetical protein
MHFLGLDKGRTVWSVLFSVRILEQAVSESLRPAKIAEDIINVKEKNSMVSPPGLLFAYRPFNVLWP